MRLHPERLRHHASSATLAVALFGLMCCAMAAPLHAQQKPAAEPEVLNGPQGTTEVGILDGSSYRIDIPPEWNHSLVVYYHGYAQAPVTFHLAERIQWQEQPLLDRHFAIAQSAYSRPGWALEQAYPQTEALRHYFLKKYGQPRETYVAGSSMGGNLVSITLELNPQPYLGGLDLCGAVGPTSESFQRRFAMRAAFDHYFPGAMPVLVPTPAAYEDTPAVRDRIVFALHTNPTIATQMRSLMGLRTDQDVADDIAYFTFVIGDIQRRAGGNPFDNTNYIYTGTNPASMTTDAELNDHVQRYTAAPKAIDYLTHHYTPSGHLGRPMLALHTLYDPLVPPSTLALYAHEVEAAGAGENLVQQYVHREGHCNITAEMIGRAFDELIQWTHNGPRPAPGLLR